MHEHEEKACILIADDNRSNLQVMDSLLSEFGFNVRVATNGLEALASIREEQPDLVLLDIHMPELDGYEVCRKLKQQESTRDIPIIFATAMNEEFNKIKGFELGAVDYVTKPINMEELKSRVTVHLQLVRTHKQLLAKAQELKTFNDIMLDREMRIIELKKEVNQLCAELERPEPYEDLE